MAGGGEGGALLKQKEIRKFVIKERQALAWHVISLLAWSKPAPSRLCHQQGPAQVSPLNLSQQSLIWTLGSGSRLKLHLEADNRDMGRWGPGGVGRGGKRQSLFLIWLSTQGWAEVMCLFFIIFLFSFSFCVIYQIKLRTSLAWKLPSWHLY